MPRADVVIARTPAEACVLRFYTLLMKKQFDEWGSLFAEDAVQENVFMPALPGLEAQFKGRDRIVFHYRTVLSNRIDHVFTIDGIHECNGGSIVIVEARGVSTVPETGRLYDQQYVMVFTLANGRIAGLREYMNPLVFQKAFDGFLVGDGAVEN
ncbi:nuclear transport factor 2 family protein [Paraburkholderia sp. LEh10]|uniref:nuclear transport factor 2 family protein n=1 Tax=Paraburkholderia sp. LEh10 TaxID=2821353 RepID=UPI001AE56A03|nr:nuclear transport factor 2 family protein [Paraburkholderia sp. LEh10]MBP0590466.1 nuclear transport factor 2 family protein [Paraburkholderia sp. LEh10]